MMSPDAGTVIAQSIQTTARGRSRSLPPIINVLLIEDGDDPVNTSTDPEISTHAASSLSFARVQRISRPQTHSAASCDDGRRNIQPTQQSSNLIITQTPSQTLPSQPPPHRKQPPLHKTMRKRNNSRYCCRNNERHRTPSLR
mmetsp:Transcript_5350/g.11269  ORF Transcript_5350/g.11269 Transcript_5350/m.11269 type:complete len:142 (+) Transcript_5350:216-641(+)